ncbi:MAG: hypothetical protein GY940_45995 [bacterium]|nr:hypothetical protein [bacterium]
MKPKKMEKKLSLGKATVTNLDTKEQEAVKGGYLITYPYEGCATWHPVCPGKTLYEFCSNNFSEFCINTYQPGCRVP